MPAVVHPKTLGSKLVSVGPLERLVFRIRKWSSKEIWLAWCPHGMGSHQSRATSSFSHKVDGLEGTSRETAGCSNS